MAFVNAFELFNKNNLNHTDFPLLALDYDHNKKRPQRDFFQQMHWHEDLQLNYVISGSLKVSFIDKEIELKENQGIFINRQVLHKLEESQGGHYRSIIFPEALVKFYQNSPMERQINAMLDNEFLACIVIKEEKNLSVLRRLDELCFQQNYKDEYGICVCLLEMMHKLMQLVPEESAVGCHARQYTKLQQCVFFIQQHYEEELSLEQISDYANLSVGYCGKLFRTLLNTTPYDYLLNYRLQKSLNLLSDGKQNITEIAMNVGFSSVSNFIQVFKKKLKITPKQYQKQLFIRDNRI